MPKRSLQDWYYHIYNRWLNKESIFLTNEDYNKFLSLISRFLRKYYVVKIISYSLLPNHFHFVLYSFNWKCISDLIWLIQRCYSRYFNKKYKRTWWKLFQWRFNSKIIRTDDYLKKCQSYVNFNPLKHNIVKNIEDWPYTSYHQIVNNNKKRQDSTVHVEMYTTDISIKDLNELEGLEF